MRKLTLIAVITILIIVISPLAIYKFKIATPGSPSVQSSAPLSLSDLHIEIIAPPTRAMPGEELPLWIQVFKPAGMALTSAQLYAYVYCDQLGLGGCLNNGLGGNDWVVNRIEITHLDPAFRMSAAHENTFELQIKVKDNALSYLDLQGTNYVKLRARLRIPASYSATTSATLQGMEIKIGNQTFHSRIAEIKDYESETQYYLSNESEVSNDIHIGTKGNLDYDSTSILVLTGQNQPTRVERALEYVSQTNGISQSRLIPGFEQHAQLQTLGLDYWRVSVTEPVNGNSYDICMDASGNILNENQLIENERLATLDKYGKLDKDLYDFLDNIDDNENVTVGIWLTNANYNIPASDQSVIISENITRAAIENAKEANILKEKPVIDFLDERGFEVIYASSYAPLIFAKLPKQGIVNLQGRGDVAGLYLSRVYKCQAYDTAENTIRAPEVWNEGITGSGIKVAIVEDDGIAFTTDTGEKHPFLNQGIYFDSLNLNIGDHATAVAGIIASTKSAHKGVAYGVPGLLSANAGYFDAPDLCAAIDWAMNNGANILNNSWGKNTNGQLDVMAIYLDYVVWTYHKTVVAAAGNFSENDNPLGNVLSPAIGYNVIAVGAINDQNTSDWSDDNMASFSCYRNPISSWGEREKPEVVAVGCSVNETGLYTTLPYDPYFDNAFHGNKHITGTSFSSPAVAGEAALIMQRNSLLKDHPEAVKAVIMASALHNIEGASRLSDKDGAGGIDCLEADSIVQGNHWATHTVIQGNLSTYSWMQTINTSAGKRVRVVLSWMSHTWSGNSPSWDELETDYNLYITDPRGGCIASDYTRGRTFEIIEFTAPSSGNYTIVVNLNRWTNWSGITSDPIAIAYSC